MCKRKIKNITRDNLVDLFAVASYNSSWFFANVTRHDYEPYRCSSDCREDKWAKVLLHGGTVYFYDAYADDMDDFYGNLPHLWESEEHAMRYSVTLDDVKKGLLSALDSNDVYVASCVRKLFEDAALIDNTDAEAIIQYIMFGEVIYG